MSARMVRMDEFKEMIKSLITVYVEGDTDIRTIQIMPDLNITLKRSELTEENRQIFIRGVTQIPNIHKGVSHINMTDCPEFPLSSHQALIIQGVGKAFGVWDLSPMNMPEAQRNITIDSDVVGMLPMNTGLNVHGVVIEEKQKIIIPEVEIINDNGK